MLVPGATFAIILFVTRRCVIGVDLGGTNVRAQALYEDGSPAGERFEYPSNAQDGVDSTVEQTVAVVRDAAQAAQGEVIGVGIAVPGHVDDAAGIIRWAPNFGKEIDGVFHYWTNVPLKAALEQGTGLRFTMGNDANLAALGEYKYGLGKGTAKCLAMLTIGTGIGGGVVMAPASVHGKASGPLMLIGSNAGGAEFGHIIVSHGGLDTNSGEYGSLEAYCQRDSIIQRARHRLIRGRASIIRDWVGDSFELVTPKMLSDAADHHDELAIEVLAEVGQWLGVGIGSLVNVFAPDVFAIGGQIANAGQWILEPARKTAQNVAVPSLWAEVKLDLATQLNDAGILGGGALAFEVFGDA